MILSMKELLDSNSNNKLVFSLTIKPNMHVEHTPKLHKIKIRKSFIPINVRINNTFYSDIKYSLLKLLCIFARLCEGNALQPLRLNFFGIDLSSHTCSQFPFIAFCGQDNRTRGYAQISHNHTTPPNLPTSVNPPSLHLLLILLQGNHHAHVALFRVAACCWRNV